MQTSISQASDSVKFCVAWWFKHHRKGNNYPISFMLLNIKESCVVAHQVKSRKASSWIPPNAYALKFDVVGLASGAPGNAGIGGVLRNSSGLMLGMFSLYVGSGDSRMAEMLAIHKAISLCAHSTALIGKEIGIVSDSAEAVLCVNAAGVRNLAFMNIIQEIQQCLFILGNKRVIFNFRSSNSLPDSLAKNGSGKGANFVIWEL
ncbi:hypothetical protein Ddye_008222 [Dipteronia dyeriana]|uniref:RNase H type-1 domain-containing protein n=1 Tax=Dipteronia dyeriana TaxID=168575 RepID=A0AAD9X938_9ROSI|nr:hypothetical protein Ddye_008222 [Dipteronia dyeriana]